MTEKTLPEKLLGWVESSGRALELRVARAFIEAGAEVRTSYNYVDAVEHIPREADVLASFNWQQSVGQRLGNLPCSLTAVVECKSTTKHPWVAFGDLHQIGLLQEETEWLAWWDSPMSAVNKHYPKAWIGQPPFQNASPATHIVTAKIGGGEHQDGDSNPANDAVRQAMSAAAGLGMEYQQQPARMTTGMFVVPAVVTNAPLFRCYLDNEGKVQLTTTNVVEVWGYRAGDASRTRVHVMREDWLPEFAKLLADRANASALVEL